MKRNPALDAFRASSHLPGYITVNLPPYERHHFVNTRASGRSNPLYARSSRAKAKLSPKRFLASRSLWETTTNTYQTRPVCPWRTWSSCSTPSRALSPIHRFAHEASSSVFPPAFGSKRFSVSRSSAIPFNDESSSTHLAQERFLEALTHNLGAGVGVLEVRHARDAPVRSSGDVRRHEWFVRVFGSDARDCARQVGRECSGGRTI